MTVPDEPWAATYSRNAVPVRCKNTASRSGSITSTLLI